MDAQPLHAEVQPFVIAKAQMDATHRGPRLLGALLMFLAQAITLSVLVYAVSWLPLEDKAPAYLVAVGAYIVTMVMWTLSEVGHRVRAIQAETLRIHDAALSCKAQH